MTDVTPEHVQITVNHSVKLPAAVPASDMHDAPATWSQQVRVLETSPVYYIR
jgi:hypothetical protein